MNYKRILLSVILFEILYILLAYFYPIQSQISQIKSFFPSPTQTLDPSITEKSYSPITLEKFKSLSKEFTVSAILKNQYHGLVINIQQNVNNYTQYPLIIRIRGTHQLDNTFLFTQRDINNLQTFRVTNNKKEPIFLNQLKSGDEVTIYEELDITKKWPNTRVLTTITKK